MFALPQILIIFRLIADPFLGAEIDFAVQLPKYVLIHQGREVPVAQRINIRAVVAHDHGVQLFTQLLIRLRDKHQIAVAVFLKSGF